MSNLSAFRFRYLSYIQDKNAFIEVELPGVDPEKIKLTYCPDGTLYVNDLYLGMSLKKNYDLNLAKAEMKHGLLKITVPEKKTIRQEIPINAT